MELVCSPCETQNSNTVRESACKYYAKAAHIQKRYFHLHLFELAGSKMGPVVQQEVSDQPARLPSAPFPFLSLMAGLEKLNTKIMVLELILCSAQCC